MAEKSRDKTPVKLYYLGPMSGCVCDELDGIEWERSGDAQTVPKWFADEKIKRAPKSWSLQKQAEPKGTAPTTKGR